MVVLIVDRGADHVRGQQVRRELDARERAVHRLRHGLHQQRFREAGDAFQQQVPVRDQRQQHAVDQLFLARHDAADFGAERADERGRVRDFALQFLKFFLSHAKLSPQNGSVLKLCIGIGAESRHARRDASRGRSRACRKSSVTGYRQHIPGKVPDVLQRHHQKVSITPFRARGWCSRSRSPPVARLLLVFLYYRRNSS